VAVGRFARRYQYRKGNGAYARRAAEAGQTADNLQAIFHAGHQAAMPKDEYGTPSTAGNRGNAKDHRKVDSSIEKQQNFSGMKRNRRT